MKTNLCVLLCYYPFVILPSYNNGLVQIKIGMVYCLFIGEILYLKTNEMMLVPLFFLISAGQSTDRRLHFRYFGGEKDFHNHQHHPYSSTKWIFPK